MDGNEPQYVLVVRPQAKQHTDQTWTAWYPKSDWSVTGTTKSEALQELRSEFERRLSAGAQRQQGRIVGAYNEGRKQLRGQLFQRLLTLKWQTKLIAESVGKEQ